MGGLALGAWGVIRGTKDCDIVPDPEPENLEQLSAVAVELDLGDLDIVQGLEGVPSYDELRAAAIDVEIAAVIVPICALEHLRAMKRAAGRPRDLVDLEDLEAAQPEEG